MSEWLDLFHDRSAIQPDSGCSGCQLRHSGCGRRHESGGAFDPSTPTALFSNYCYIRQRDLTKMDRKPRGNCVWGYFKPSSPRRYRYRGLIGCLAVKVGAKLRRPGSWFPPFSSTSFSLAHTLATGSFSSNISAYSRATFPANQTFQLKYSTDHTQMTYRAWCLISACFVARGLLFSEYGQRGRWRADESRGHDAPFRSTKPGSDRPLYMCIELQRHIGHCEQSSSHGEPHAKVSDLMIFLGSQPHQIRPNI